MNASEARVIRTRNTEPIRMKATAKQILERLSGYRVWLEPSTDLSQVSDLIGMLAPVAVNKPLVRLGGAADGGYLAPEDLDGIDAVVSPGVSTEVSFDLAMTELGFDVYMMDGSVDGPPVRRDKFHFEKKFLDVVDDEQNVRLDSICRRIDRIHAGDRILQMDIEGAEYRVLLDASDDALRSFRIMLIEFHNLDRLFGAFSFRMIRATFQKLLRTHNVVHIHPNNVSPPRVRRGIQVPPVMEFTFYRKDRAEVLPSHKLKFPHELDRANIHTAKDYPLPRCWYR